MGHNCCVGDRAETCTLKVSVKTTNYSYVEINRFVLRLEKPLQLEFKSWYIIHHQYKLFAAYV